MIRLQPTTVLLPLLLAVGGCQVIRTPDGMIHLAAGTDTLNGQADGYSGVEGAHMRTPYPIIYGLNFTTDKDARVVANQLVRAYTEGDGMQSVALDVQRCYAAADADHARNSGWPSEYRFCVLYDGVAYRVDNTRRQRGLPRTGYFEPQLTADRWRRHVLLSGQGRQSELDAFMMKGAAMVGPYLPLRVYGISGKASR